VVVLGDRWVVDRRARNDDRTVTLPIRGRLPELDIGHFCTFDSYSPWHAIRLSFKNFKSLPVRAAGFGGIPRRNFPTAPKWDLILGCLTETPGTATRPPGGSDCVFFESSI